MYQRVDLMVQGSLDAHGQPSMATEKLQLFLLVLAHDQLESVTIICYVNIVMLSGIGCDVCGCRCRLTYMGFMWRRLCKC